MMTWMTQILFFFSLWIFPFVHIGYFPLVFSRAFSFFCCKKLRITEYYFSENEEKMQPKRKYWKKRKKEKKMSEKKEAKWDARSVIEMMRSAEHIFVFSPI